MRSAQRDRRALTLLEHAPDVVAVVGDDGRIIDVNPAARLVLGWDPSELIGRSFREVLHPDDLMRSPCHSSEEPGELRLRHQDGSWRTIEIVSVDVRDTPAGGFAVYGHDVTARRVAEAQLLHCLHHDPVTGLPLRARFEELVSGVLADLTHAEAEVAVLAVHLGGLDLVDQSLGHAAGDHAVAIVADRLVRALPGGAHVGRHGSDLLVCDVVGDTEGAWVLANRVAGLLGEPVVVGTEELFLPVAVGAAVGRPGGPPAGEVLVEAFAALGRARRRRVRIELSEPGLRQEATQWMQTQSALQRALEREELRLEYQPIIDLRSGELRSLEALLRWDQPRLGTMAPNQFIPIAEEVGAIQPIGRWVVRTACRQLARWQQRHGCRAGISVNVSPRQLSDPRLADDVAEALSRNDLDPSSLTLEMTESTIVPGGRLPRGVEELHRTGVSIAVDDFGTGFSSLGQLRDLPVDVLKLDRSFVRDVAEPGGPELAIVNSVVGLAGALGLATVAEGVETTEQASSLRGVGCDRAQGFLFSPPQRPEDLDVVVRDGVVAV